MSNLHYNDSSTPRKQQSQGFTLVEMLAAMAVFSLVMLGALNLQQNSSQVSRVIVNTNQMQEELRNAAAIITDEVQRALYVFPPCGVYTSTGVYTTTFAAATCPTSAFPSGYVINKLNVTFSSFTLAASGSTTQRPDTSSRTWEVGQTSAPILAMIVAPRRPASSTVSGACNASTSEEKSRSCYQFVAYYPVLRSNVTRASVSDTSTDKLDIDSENTNRWVLMEFRENLDDIIAASSVNITGIGVVNIPAVRWDQVGCNSVGYDCSVASGGIGAVPTPDPTPSIQTRDFAIPALERGTTDSRILASFVSRMYQTRSAVGAGANPGQANILMVGIRPITGFQIEYPLGSVDARGATEVRIRMQSQVFRNGKEFRVPNNDVLEVYASPRNLPPSN